MALPVFNTSWQPQYGASKKKAPRIKRARMGDGYEQRRADGINNDLEEWSLTFKEDPTTINAIDDFLIARGATEAFTWTSPKSVSMSVVCYDWNVAEDSIGWKTLTCTFNQVPEV